MRQKIFSRFGRYLREYTKNTSFHGCRYIGERRTNVEGCFWVIILSLAFAGSFYLINEAYSKWRDNPVIVSFDASHMSISNIPFPSVTVCPESKSRQSDYSHSKMIRKLIEGDRLTNTELKRALFMSNICDPNILNYYYYFLNGSFQLDNESYEHFMYELKELYELAHRFKPNEFYSFIYNVSVDFPVENCRFIEENIPCKELFEPIITDEGVCYIFNMLDFNDIYENNVKYSSDGLSRVSKVSTWSIENGYLEVNGTNETDRYPKRAQHAGAKFGLSFELVTQKKDIDDLCKNGIQGFRIGLHSPIEVPVPGLLYFSVPLDSVAVVGAVQPKLITTTNLAKSYSPRKRGCYLAEEKKLKWFKVYSQMYCYMQCVTEVVMDVHNCSLFWNPREKDLCGAILRETLAKIESYIKRKHGNEKTTDFILDRSNSKKEKPKMPDCDCLPSCTELTYDVDTTTSTWNWRKTSQKLKTKFQDSSTKDDEIFKSKVLFYFKHPEFVPLKRHELYGTTDFFANFGGLLGLFTGFSLLSLMELIYFVTIRICCNIRLYGTWSGRNN